jgi:PAS domain S-box-containing protein
LQDKNPQNRSSEIKKVEEELIKAHQELEARVLERTEQLEQSNERMQHEIAERKKVEDALRESESLFRQLTENIRDVFYVIDPQKKRITYVSPAFNEIYGHSEKVLYENPHSWIKYVHPDDKESLREAVKDQAITGSMNEEYRIIRPDGEIRWLRARAFPLRDENNKIYRITGVAEDITESKNAIRLTEDSLKEKETLLKEIHHRVKNNLQIISSFLHLQSFYVKDESVKEIFSDIENRIRAMALIHEKLHQPKDLIKINVQEYIEDLVYKLRNSYGAKAAVINIEMNIENIFLTMDISSNLGLIINELVSNSIKHAYEAGQSGTIYVSLTACDDEGFELIIRDDGKGISKQINFKETESLGLQLFNAFVDQIDGTVELNVNKGTEFKIKFPGKKKN